MRKTLWNLELMTFLIIREIVVIYFRPRLLWGRWHGKNGGLGGDRKMSHSLPPYTGKTQGNIHNDMSEEVLRIFSNLKWWTKRAQHGYIVWYFLVPLFFTTKNCLLKKNDRRPQTVKIEFLDPDRLVWSFRCWAAQGFVCPKDDIYLWQWRLGWFGISFCWRHFPRLEVTVSLDLCHECYLRFAIAFWLECQN